jgi:PleD family two-component response regulator
VEVMQRLLAQVREARPLPDWPQQGYTASAGLVQARSGERPEDVMARADVALYLAKDGGRDRCVAMLD